jgi:hypothetical protein
MAKRLTKAQRETIHERLMARKYPEGYKAPSHLKKTSADLFQRMVVASWGGSATYDLIKGIANPSDAPLFDTSISVSAYKESSTITFSADYPELTPYSFETHSSLSALTSKYAWRSDSTLADDIASYAEKVLDAHKEYEKTRDAIWQVLNSVNSYTRLYEIWPELKTVIPVVEDETIAGTSLAPVMADLNRTLGLPAEAAAAA